MFHFAPPDVAGFGVMMSTSPLTRSSQPLIFFGLPGRTESTTTESVTMPLYSSEFQSSATSPASTVLVMSGCSEKATTSAGSPLSTARRWSPEAPNEVENSTPSPSVVFWKPGITASS